jgi:DNA repair exonuclease SbcCD ATPase subunit
VKLWVDGNVVTRRRGSSKENDYELNGDEFKAFGRGVPEPIAAALNIGDISWQGQHDAAYWFGDSPGEVSRQLNAIVDLGIIDSTLAEVARARTRAKTRMDLSEDELDRAKSEYDGLRWAGRFGEDVEALATSADALAKARSRAEGLEEKVDAARLLHARIRAAGGAASAGRGVTALGEDCVELADRTANLVGLIRAAKAAQTTTLRPVPNILKLERAKSKYAEAIGSPTRLEEILGEIGALQETICHLETEQKEAESALPKMCPLCGQSS